MKKLFIILLSSMLFNIIGFGQHYEPFISETKQWRYVQTLYLTKKSTQTLYLVTLGYFNGDTLINNIKYSKFYNKNIEPNNVSLDTTIYLSYFFNEDTINKKVYVYDFHFGKTALLYDFTIKEGDFFNIYVLNDIYVKHTVIKVDTILTLSKKLKRIMFNDSTTWIESIGCIIKTEIPSAGDLICVKENNSVLYLNKNYNNCDTIFQQGGDKIINETNNYKYISLFPNPIERTSVLKVNINQNSKSKIEIYNTIGLLIKEDYFIDNYPIGTIKIAKGLYIYRVINKDKIIGIDKIIIK